MIISILITYMQCWIHRIEQLGVHILMLLNCIILINLGIKNDSREGDADFPVPFNHKLDRCLDLSRECLLYLSVINDKRKLATVSFSTLNKAVFPWQFAGWGASCGESLRNRLSTLFYFMPEQHVLLPMTLFKWSVKSEKKTTTNNKNNN